MGSAINLNVLRAMVDADIALPFGAMVMRPMMTFRMGSGALMRAGEETGHTITALPLAVKVPDPALHKVHINFSIYGKCIIHAPYNIDLAKDLFFLDIGLGNDTAWLPHEDDRGDPEDGPWEHVAPAALNYRYRRLLKGGGSLISTLMWNSEFDGLRELRDVTGRFQFETGARGPKGLTTYGSAAWVKWYWGFTDPTEADEQHRPYVSATRDIRNTLLFEGYSRRCSAATGEYDLVSNGASPLGQVRPGLAAVLRGTSSWA